MFGRTFAKSKPIVSDAVKRNHGSHFNARQQHVEAIVLELDRRPALQLRSASANLKVETWGQHN